MSAMLTLKIRFVSRDLIAALICAECFSCAFKADIAFSSSDAASRSSLQISDVLTASLRKFSNWDAGLCMLSTSEFWTVLLLSKFSVFKMVSVNGFGITLIVTFECGVSFEEQQRRLFKAAFNCNGFSDAVAAFWEQPFCKLVSGRSWSNATLFTPGTNTAKLFSHNINYGTTRVDSLASLPILLTC